MKKNTLVKIVAALGALAILLGALLPALSVIP